MCKSWPLEILTEAERGLIRLEAIRLLPHATIKELPHELQGYCSYTLLANDTTSSSNSHAYIVQFRPFVFALPLQHMKSIVNVYQSYAPVVKSMGYHLLEHHGHLQVSRCSFVPGVPLSIVQPKYEDLNVRDFIRQKRLVASFADFVSRSWTGALTKPETPACDGKVGRLLSIKLQQLAQQLPGAELCAIATCVYEHLHLLELSPIVLTHGDILPSNVMINTVTDSIEGLIDWAEAEYLPFGACFYGLEHLLGYTALNPSGPRFMYYTSAADLRQHFWNELATHIPQLCDERVLEAVLFARDVGVLLWFGFAWDDGAIDRVINADDDPQELMLLRTFLNLGDESNIHHQCCSGRPRATKL